MGGTRTCIIGNFDFDRLRVYDSPFELFASQNSIIFVYTYVLGATLGEEMIGVQL